MNSVNRSPHRLYVNFIYSVESDSLSPTIFQHVCHAVHSYLPRFAAGFLAGHADLLQLFAIADWPGIALQPIFIRKKIPNCILLLHVRKCSLRCNVVHIHDSKVAVYN